MTLAVTRTGSALWPQMYSLMRFESHGTLRLLSPQRFSKTCNEAVLPLGNRKLWFSKPSVTIILKRLKSSAAWRNSPLLSCAQVQYLHFYGAVAFSLPVASQPHISAPLQRTTVYNRLKLPVCSEGLFFMTSKPPQGFFFLFSTLEFP